MLRGINRQQIFEDDEDRERLLETIENYKDLCGYTIYAYCLMGNHIHRYRFARIAIVVFSRPVGEWSTE